MADQITTERLREMADGPAAGIESPTINEVVSLAREALAARTSQGAVTKDQVEAAAEGMWRAELDDLSPSAAEARRAAIWSEESVSVRDRWRRHARAALTAAACVAPEPVAKDWLDDFDGDKPIYTDRELIDLLGTLLQAQVREQRINSIEELHGMLRHIGRSQRAHRALTGADSNA